jgi:hypothetical protein
MHKHRVMFLFSLSVFFSPPTTPTGLHVIFRPAQIERIIPRLQGERAIGINIYDMIRENFFNFRHFSPARAGSSEYTIF